MNKEEEKKLADNINKQFEALEPREALKQFYIETYCSYLKLCLIIKGMCKLRFFLAWMNIHFCPPFSYFYPSRNTVLQSKQWSSILRTIQTVNCKGTPADRKLKLTTHVHLVNVKRKL